MRRGQISVVDSQEEWYNAYEKDIAVANFYYSKPTSIGNNHLLSIIVIFYFLLNHLFRVQKDCQHGPY